MYSDKYTAKSGSVVLSMLHLDGDVPVYFVVAPYLLHPFLGLLWPHSPK